MDYTILGGPFRGFQYLQVTNPSNTFNGHVHGINAEGGNGAHENMQPSIALLHCRRD